MFLLKAKSYSTMAKGEKVSHESSGLSKREWNELMTSFVLKKRLFNFLSYIFE